MKQIIFISLIFLSNALLAQSPNGNLSNLRSKIFPATTDSILVDSLSIVPNSLSIKNLSNDKIIDTIFYKINYTKSIIKFDSIPFADSVRVNYRIFPFNFNQSFAHKDTSLIQSLDMQAAGLYQYEIRQQKNKATTSLFDRDGLVYSGSFGRGLAFGNSQDLTVNSNFNLQMSGKIANDIEILAAITDSNIPFQPEGNTQQIQEFDRIFIQLKKDKSLLLLGDYELRKPTTYFMNFNRKLQGVQFSSSIKTGENSQINTATSGAIAKGNFNRMTFVGEEGNQGPYKLTGANNELFIIVLSASENVYIDGQALERGAENDYIIDYNTAEITFTEKQLINKDKRIVIEFEYSDQNYLRSLFYQEITFKSKKLSLKANLFTEQDAKNQRLAEDAFSETERLILDNAGDDIQNAILTNFSPVNFDSTRILYQQIDTFFNGQSYTIFQKTNDRNQPVFAPAFRWVGEQMGEYMLSTNSVNGRVYEWIAPDSLGNRKGSYDIGNVLITPQKRQLATLSANYQFNENNTLNTELAVSNKDVNTFSAKNDDDDKGLAYMLDFQSIIPINKKKSTQLKTNFQYEFVQKNFQELQPYRPVEFVRNWNLSQQNRTTDEHIGKASISLQQSTFSNLTYQFSTFLKGEKKYEGYQHLVAGKYEKKGWNWRLNSSYLTSRDSLFESQFLRPNIAFSKRFPKLKNWQIGASNQTEYNAIYTKNESDLASNSFYFNQFESYIQTPDSAKNRLQLKYIRRWDYAPQSEQFGLANIGNTINFKGALSKKHNNQLSWDMSYRHLAIKDTFLSKEKKDSKSFIGNINYNLAIKKGVVKIFTRYELGAGQRQKTAYFYNIVPPNQATYIWLDRNEDNEQDLEEFELITDANRNEVNAVYARFILPTNEYERTNTVGFTQNLSLNPRAIWFNSKGIRKLISYFAFQTNWLFKREIVADQTQTAHYFPTNLSAKNDSLVLTEDTGLRSTLAFNKKSSTFFAELYLLQNSRKNLLINGTDKTAKQEQGLNIKLNLGRQFTMDFKSNFGEKSIVSEAFPSRNYAIDYWGLEPKLTFQPNTKFRLTGSYEYKNNHNNLNEMGDFEASIKQELSSTFRYGSPSKQAINLKLSYINIAYNNSLTDNQVNNSSAASYQLLEGLTVGTNWLWSASFDTRLSNNLFLRLQYNGRKTAENPIFNSGTASMRANF